MDFSKTTKSPFVLKEENKRYAFDSGKEMRGFLKVEYDTEKCLMVVIMDNVKFFPQGEYVYKLILAGTKNEKRCYHLIGNISLSAYGKGEASFRVNPHDLDGKGSSLKDFSMAIIAAMSTVNGHEPLHPVLKGSFSMPEAKPSTPQIEPASNKSYNGFYNKILLDRCIEIARSQDKYQDILPFSDGPSDTIWKKLTDVTLFPMIAPGAEAPIKKYGHFLWGYNDKHYFLAVPGRFFPEEQPDKGKSGFVSWLPILGMEETADDNTISVEERRKNIYGYWIASISRYNGEIEEIPLIDG